MYSFPIPFEHMDGPELTLAAVDAIEHDQTETLIELIQRPNFEMGFAAQLLEIATQNMADNPWKQGENWVIYSAWGAVSRYLIFEKKVNITLPVLEKLCKSGNSHQLRKALGSYPDTIDSDTFFSSAAAAKDVLMIRALLDAKTSGNLSANTAKELRGCLEGGVFDSTLIRYNNNAVMFFARIVASYAKSIKVQHESVKPENNNHQVWPVLFAMRDTLAACGQVPKHVHQKCWAALAQEVEMSIYMHAYQDATPAKFIGLIQNRHFPNALAALVAIIEDAEDIAEGDRWMQALAPHCHLDLLKLLAFAAAQKVDIINSPTGFSRLFKRDPHAERNAAITSLQTTLRKPNIDRVTKEELVRKMQNVLSHDYSNSHEIWGTLYKKLALVFPLVDVAKSKTKMLNQGS